MIYSFVVSFVLGIAFENFFDLGWSFGILIFLISSGSFLFFLRPKESARERVAKIFLIIGLSFALGILRMTFTDISPDPNLYKLVGEKISFKATISDEPDVRDTSVRYTVKPIGFESLVLIMADRFPEFQYGDKIKVSGKLDLPKNFENDNGTEFDYISYLAKDKIHFLIYRPQVEKLEGNEGNKIISYLYSLKNISIEKISAVVPEPNASLLGGVIFGTKQSLGEKLLDDFRKVGLIHIIVLSGYNITIIAAGVFFATSFLGKRNLSFILSIIFITLFSVMVGLGATVVRAGIMALIAILARFLGRPADALRFLFIAGFLMVFWNPLILFYDPSFQLSFMATLGLILFSPFVFNFISEHKFAKYIPIKYGLREIISATLAVQFFVLPLLIRMAGFVSLISFIVNPLILPLVPLAMAFGAITGAIGIFSEILSWPFGIVSYFISQVMIVVTEFSASLPFATFQTNSLSLWLVFVWYVGYGVLYLMIKKEK